MDDAAEVMQRDTGALVLVDYQARLMPALHGGEAALADALFAAGVAQDLGVPVLGTEQNPAGLGPNDDRIRAVCSRTVAKTHFDACADGLLDALRAARPGLRQVVVAGCEAHVCLMQTALGLRRAGLAVFVLGSACASRRPEDKALALARLVQAGARVVNAEMLAFEWLGHCAGPAFKPVLSRVKARGA